MWRRSGRRWIRWEEGWAGPGDCRVRGLSAHPPAPPARAPQEPQIKPVSVPHRSRQLVPRVRSTTHPSIRLLLRRYHVDRSGRSRRCWRPPRAGPIPRQSRRRSVALARFLHVCRIWPEASPDRNGVSADRPDHQNSTGSDCRSCLCIKYRGSPAGFPTQRRSKAVGVGATISCEVPGSASLRRPAPPAPA